MSGPILEGAHFESGRRGRNFAYWHLLYRAVWNVTWLLLAAWTPPPLHRWRVFLLNLFGAKVHKTARVWGSSRIWYPPNLTMGRGSVLGWQSLAYTQGEIVLEDFAEVAQFVQLMTGTHDVDHIGFQLYTKPIRICSHAWLAAGSFVGPGVTVHEGAVLGARSVTMKDLAAWGIYVGAPARKIRDRRNFLKDDRG